MISTGSTELDIFLGGYKNELTAIYGPAGSGKTTLALMAAIRLATLGQKTLFIDAERGFSLDRYQQLAGPRYQHCLDYLLLHQPATLDEQHKHAANATTLLASVKLIVVDTIGTHYRKEFKKDVYATNALLEKEIRLLREFAKHVPVLLTNQVYANLKNDNVAMIANTIIEPWCGTIIELKRDPRRLLITTPTRAEAHFAIHDKGITLQ